MGLYHNTCAYQMQTNSKTCMLKENRVVHLGKCTFIWQLLGIVKYTGYAGMSPVDNITFFCALRFQYS